MHVYAYIRICMYKLSVIAYITFILLLTMLVCMYVCIHTYTTTQEASIVMYDTIHTLTHTYVRTYTRMYVCMYVCVCEGMYGIIHSDRSFLCGRVCIYTCMHAY